MAKSFFAYVDIQDLTMIGSPRRLYHGVDANSFAFHYVIFRQTRQKEAQEKSDTTTMSFRMKMTI